MTQVRGLLESKFCSVGKNCDSTALNFSPALKREQANEQGTSLSQQIVPAISDLRFVCLQQKCFAQQTNSLMKYS